MGFIKTVCEGYRIMWQNFNRKHNDFLPRMLSDSGTGLMMIGSALIARESCKEEVQKALQDAQAVYLEETKIVENEKKIAKIKKKFVAGAKKSWKIVKVYRKGVICDVAGAALQRTGLGVSEHGKHKTIKAAAVLGAQFAAYRGAVRKDLGDEADLKYMTGGSIHEDPEKHGKNESAYYDESSGEIRAKVDPNAFRFLFSEETCPSVWDPNYDLRLHKLKHIEEGINLQYRATWEDGGAISLNQMRRGFGGLKPHKMDVDIGGMFGRVHDKSKPNNEWIKLHFQDDVDFMEGRKDWCWIIFDCDPEPIVGRMNKRFTEVEK